MGFSDEIKRALTAKLHPSLIEKRRMGGKELSYLEAHVVIRELNRVFGADGWWRETVVMDRVDENLYKGRDGREMREIVYLAKVRLSVLAGAGHIVVKEGTGSGSASRAVGQPGAGDLYGQAAKQAESDAMKRAAMQLGDIFGLALYDESGAHIGEEPVAPSGDLASRVGACADVATLEALWSDLSPNERAGARHLFVARKGALA